MPRGVDFELFAVSARIVHACVVQLIQTVNSDGSDVARKRPKAKVEGGGNVPCLS